MIRIFDKKLKKIHIIFFALLPFFKILDPESSLIFHNEISS